MKKVKKKINDLEKKQKEISDKLDKYEYNFINEQKKANDVNDYTFKNNNNNNFESCAKIDKDYQKVLDKRLDEIMGKINDNIINQNYLDFYNFLLKGRPKNNKQKKDNQQKQNLSQNTNNSNEKKNEKINNDMEGDYKKQNIKKENKIDNINNIKNENNVNNNINKKLINIDNNTIYKEQNNDVNMNNDIDIDNNKINNNNNFNGESENKNKINELRLNNIPKKANIHISYNGPANINLEDIQNQQKLELLHKQQNIFLGNELTLLKCKLNKVRKENEFLQSLIHEKGMVKNTNVLEKFIGGFIEKLSLNWNEIVESIIDEIIIDEIYELNEIDLNKVNYEKNKNKLINNLFNAGLGGIIPEKSEVEENTNVDLLIGNIEQIKKIINSVKESENNIKAKYNI